ncbi:DUF3426 domain-containing protein [Cellvibrio fontiphilus]|uniref:DUF3426 domain-containing protein n=1 Tax=Cellvibrio fontiphilus TaxID=1815559 RepID=A0ABV7FC18_9GAMM
MTSASNPMITRCPKCGTAFRVTQSQLQSAKGAVRCGSCLNVFKAQDYLVAVKPKATEPATISQAPKSAPSQPASALASIPKPATTNHRIAQPTSINPTTSIKQPLPNIPVKPVENTSGSKFAVQELQKPNPSALVTPSPQAALQATINTPIDTTKNDRAKLAKPVIDDGDDILISDDMEERETESGKYEFDGFMDVDVKPTTDVSLFERKIRSENEDTNIQDTDESWAEMLIEEEEDKEPQLGVLRPKSDEELADEALDISRTPAAELTREPTINDQKPVSPGLVFSLIEEPQPTQTQADELVLSEELAQLPDNQGFKHSSDTATTAQTDTPAEPTTTESRTIDSPSDGNKRQIKTQPKIRAYDGSRTALLMNIMPAPIEFTAKRMHRWYQRKLWTTLSLVGLIALAVQIAWFKFDALSRIEPYRTAYLFVCPYLGCELPPLVDIQQISTSNLVVREHPDTENALAVDVMLVNSAPFEQPFPDLTLVFTDIDNNLVAQRRFTPKDYLGGELAGADLMPRNQKIYITLDIVDPGAEAVNYRIYIAE